MVKNHLKRLAAPRSWNILRKERKFITRPKPGKSFETSIALNNVMKQLLNKSQTTKEVKFTLKNSQVLVNGKRVYEHRRPVAFMDIVSFPDNKENFVVTLTQKGKLATIPVKDGSSRVVKIRNKTLTGKKVQINCTDGTNLLVDKDSYKTGDSLVLNAGKIAKHLALKPGSIVMLAGGKHVGKKGKVVSVEGNLIKFNTGDEELSTAKRHAIVIGESKEEVEL